MPRFNYIIALTSVATGGKDTLFTILQKILSEYSINLRRVAFADILKAEVNPFCMSKYNISAFTKDLKEKEIVRLVMLAHGKAMRILSNGNYWTDLIESQIKEAQEDNELVVITDLRYANPEYPRDELAWLKGKHNGILIHIERVLNNGQILKSQIDDEIRFDPILKKNADFYLKWITSSDESVLTDTINIQLKDLISKITQN